MQVVFSHQFAINSWWVNRELSYLILVLAIFIYCVSLKKLLLKLFDGDGPLLAEFRGPVDVDVGPVLEVGKPKNGRGFFFLSNQTALVETR